MFLVMGITGKVGGATAKHLLAQGKKVRALVRDRQKAASWAERGIELVDGDWTDAASLTRALDGVEGAYVMMPPIMAPSRDFREAKAVIAAHAVAFAKRPPPRLVMLSSWGSERTSGLGTIMSTALMEQAFRASPFPVVFLRAGGFLENYLHGLDTAKGGTLSIFNPPERPIPFIATDDIGAEAARRLTGPGWTGAEVVELGTMLPPSAIATQLGEVLGREVTAVMVPRDGWATAAEHMGIPRGDTWAFEEAMEGINSGWLRFGVEGTKRVEGRTSPREVFAAAAPV